MYWVPAYVIAVPDVYSMPGICKLYKFEKKKKKKRIRKILFNFHNKWKLILYYCIRYKEYERGYTQSETIPAE